ncbi:hypothetical protein D3C78_728430 [compost metagenome]
MTIGTTGFPIAQGNDVRQRHVATISVGYGTFTGTATITVDLDLLTLFIMNDLVLALRYFFGRCSLRLFDSAFDDLLDGRVERFNGTVFFHEYPLT